MKKLYCLIGLGSGKKIKKLLDDLINLTETEVRYGQYSYILIAVFGSSKDLSDIKKSLQNDELGLFIFNLDSDHIIDLPEKLYKPIFTDLDVLLEDSGFELMNKLTNGGDFDEKNNDDIYEMIDLENLTEKRRQELIDELLDKGVENLTIDEKKLLDMLSKQ